MEKKLLLAINPGSTSTKIGLFQGTELVFEETLRYDSELLAAYERVIDQYSFRKDSVMAALKEHQVDLNGLDAIVGRGGVVKPIPGGVYAVNDALVADLRAGVQGEHASSLGGLIAREIADELGIPSYIVDPVVVDELEPVARYSGLPELPKRSIFHALNQKAVAHRFAAEQGKRYDELNLIIAHLGGGISIGAHRRGKVIDVNNALNGEGPFSPERSGGLAAVDLMHLVLKSDRSAEEWQKRMVGKGGMVAYLGTNDGREVSKRIAAGDEEAKMVYAAMAYQVAKEIGASAAVLCGKIDAILLTGGLAYDQAFTAMIGERVEFLAPVRVFPGEDELLALVEGALRVLNGQEQVREYV